MSISEGWSRALLSFRTSFLTRWFSLCSANLIPTNPGNISWTAKIIQNGKNNLFWSGGHSWVGGGSDSSWLPPPGDNCINQISSENLCQVLYPISNNFLPRLLRMRMGWLCTQGDPLPSSWTPSARLTTSPIRSNPPQVWLHVWIRLELILPVAMFWLNRQHVRRGHRLRELHWGGGCNLCWSE